MRNINVAIEDALAEKKEQTGRTWPEILERGIESYLKAAKKQTTTGKQ